jgi:hypothetical protein
VQHRDDSDPQPWYLVPLTPDSVTHFRRWNLITISILALVILGFLGVAIIPQPAGTNTPSVASKVS